MELSKKVKGTIASVFVMGSLFFGQAAYSQAVTTPQSQEQQNQNYSETELKKFLQANEKAMAVQQQNQEAMMAAVEKENLSIEKFNEMAQAHQQQKLAEVKATPEEMAAFNNAAQSIIEMQPKIEQEIKEAIEEEGISVRKYEEIMMAYQQNPNVKAKLNSLLEEHQK